MPMIDVIILAGGKGQRLHPLTLDKPKPMVDVAGRPFLEYIFDDLDQNKINRTIMSVGYKSEQIINYFGSKWKGMDLVYIEEDEPLGTGGAIVNCLDNVISEQILILNGDTYYNVPISKMLDYHKNNGAELTIALKPMQNFSRYGNVLLSGNFISKIEEKVSVDNGLINCGRYIVNKALFSRFKFPVSFSFEEEIFQNKLSKIRAVGFQSNNYFIDIGVHEDYERAQNEVIELR